MQYIQEHIANDLFEDLKKLLNKGSIWKIFSTNPIQVTIEGAGVHWKCNLLLGNRKCKINCFEYRHYEIANPEYLISFIENDEIKALGRTQNKNEVMNSCKDWISNKSVMDLYENYSFVDNHKRLIANIELELEKQQFELINIEKILSSDYGCDIYDYCIKNKNRSCWLSGFGVNEPITFRFLWDDCQLFEVEQNDLKKMALILKLWLIDFIAPTELEREIPEIKVGELAKYYEKGEGIKGEFIQSWEIVEKFYLRINESFSDKVLILIEVLKNKGFNESIRASTSLGRMILTRSRRYGGPIFEQPLLCFSFNEDKMQVTNELNQELKFDCIELNEDIIRLIKKLEKTEIR